MYNLFIWLIFVVVVFFRSRHSMVGICLVHNQPIRIIIRNVLLVCFPRFFMNLLDVWIWSVFLTIKWNNERSVFSVLDSSWLLFWLHACSNIKRWRQRMAEAQHDSHYSSWKKECAFLWSVMILLRPVVVFFLPLCNLLRMRVWLYAPRLLAIIICTYVARSERALHFFFRSSLLLISFFKSCEAILLLLVCLANKLYVLSYSHRWFGLLLMTGGGRSGTRRCVIPTPLLLKRKELQ